MAQTRWLRVLQVPLVVVVLAVAVAVQFVVADVSELRASLEARVGVLRELQRLDRLEPGWASEDPDERLTAWGAGQEAARAIDAELRRLDASPAVLEAATALRSSLAVPGSPSEAESAASTLVTRVRKETSAISSRLGERWRWLGWLAQGVVVLALLAIGLSEGLVWAMGRSRRFEQLSSRDPLTRLLNRSGLQDSAARELARLQRSSQPVGALMLDLDAFKQINDEHGHPAGDAVLQGVAERLRGALRPFDVAARVGGDEFFVLLPGCDDDATRRVARRVLRAVCVPMPTGGQLLPVSVSVGCASSDGDRGLATLMKAADEALYACKEARPAGGNDGPPKLSLA